MRNIKFLREAAAVRRCHTVPHIGEYTVGCHTFNMLAMLRLLWPEAPIELVWAIIEHDLPERLTGDIPYTSKKAGVTDSVRLGEIENSIIKKYLGRDHLIGLDNELMAWLKGLDLLELYLWCKDQINLGNLNVIPMMRRIESIVYMDKSVPVEIKEVYSAAYEWQHGPDLGDAA